LLSRGGENAAAYPNPAIAPFGERELLDFLQRPEQGVAYRHRGLAGRAGMAGRSA